jgi:hypothetical protein
MSSNPADNRVWTDLAKRLVTGNERRAYKNIVLHEGNRRIIGSKFMKTLCKKNSNAERNGTTNRFRIDELWESLGGFNQEMVAPLAIRYFRDEMRYIIQHKDGTIGITQLGKQHCGDRDQAFTLPEDYQPDDKTNLFTQ